MSKHADIYKANSTKLWSFGEPTVFYSYCKAILLMKNIQIFKDSKSKILYLL